MLEPRGGHPGRSLKQAGYVEGQNLTVEYRWAEGHYDRLPALAAELVNRPVSLIIAAGGSDPGRAAKAATSTIPIVFITAADPIKAGLVAGLNRPEANLTGISMIGSTLEAKRIELLHEMLPQAATIGVLINPQYPAAKAQAQEVEEATGPAWHQNRGAKRQHGDRNRGGLRDFRGARGRRVAGRKRPVLRFGARKTGGAGDRPQTAGDLVPPRIRRRRRPHQLRCRILAMDIVKPGSMPAKY